VLEGHLSLEWKLELKIGFTDPNIFYYVYKKTFPGDDSGFYLIAKNSGIEEMLGYHYDEFYYHPPYFFMKC